jgi:tetratricopeptide (TPR) repeat protein
LALIHAFCGAFDEAYRLVEQAAEFAEARQPAWRSFPQAGLVRIHLLQGDVESAQRAAGDVPLRPISIPYARFTIFVILANIELAYVRGDYDAAFSMVDELLDEVVPLTRLDVPDVLRWKGLIFMELRRYDEALQVLTEACSLASGMGANLLLWLSYASLADVQEKLDHHQEAKSNQVKARTIIEQIAESLREIGLAESFLEQPQVRKVMRG